MNSYSLTVNVRENQRCNQEWTKQETLATLETQDTGQDRQKK